MKSPRPTLHAVRAFRGPDCEPGGSSGWGFGSKAGKLSGRESLRRTAEMGAVGRRAHFFGAFSAPRQYVRPRASPRLDPAEEMNGSLDILAVKSRSDRPTLADWKIMKTQADGIFAMHKRFLFVFLHKWGGDLIYAKRNQV